MEFETLLESRRSIRSYDDSQTARYYCVLGAEAKEKFAKECLPEFNANNTKGTGAYVVTTFVANRSGFDRSGNPDNECGNGWGYYDLGLHNENFILKAKELGLGTLVMGIRDGEKIQEMLEIPETEMVVSVISVGYIKENPPKPKRKDVDDILKFF